MNAGNRILLIIYALFTTILAIVAMFLLFGWQTAFNYLEQLSIYPFYKETMWVILGLYVLSGPHFIYSSLKKEKVKQIVVQEGMFGQVKVSFTAMQDLVDRLVLQNSGIKEVKSKVIILSQGVGIQIKAIVTPDVQIPALSLKVQEQIKGEVKDVVGIEVKDVQILIESISANKPRVE